MISVRFGSARRWWFAILVLSLLTALSLAIAPAQARNLFATEQTQNLFVANQSTNTIREFSQTGADLGYFATTGLNGPTGLAFDKRGNLYVSNINDNTIREFSPTGADLGNFATTGLSSPVASPSTSTATSTWQTSAGFGSSLRLV